MIVNKDRLPCKWCGRRGPCDPQCEFYSGLQAETVEKKSEPSKIQEMTYELEVREAMCRNIISVTPENSMNDVREILRKNRISGLPVLENGTLVGIISLENFITSIIKGGIADSVDKHMSTNVKVLYADEPLVYAVSKFEELKFGRFPVLDSASNTLAGILTKGDVIRCLLNKIHISYQAEEIHTYRASHIFEDIRSDGTTVILSFAVVAAGNYRLAGKQCSNLKRNLLRLGLTPKIIRRITVATCEAEMNIIVFTEGGEIIVRIEEEKVTVNAIDKGPGIPDIELAMQSGYSTAPDWVREMGFGAGMGLPNIKSCTDEMRIESSSETGTNLEFVVYLKNQ